jgi:TRAP-type C4-dicarboxylate transport system substrate-binding protein
MNAGIIPCLAGVGLLMLAVSAWAAPTWDQLSPAQRQVLSGMQQEWNTLPEERRDNLVQGADKWLSLSPEEKAKAESRLQRFNSLDPDRKARMRQLRDEYRNMTPEQRADIKERYKAFKSLPKEERDRIREHFKELRARPGGAEAECGADSLTEKLDCVGVPPPAAEPDTKSKVEPKPAE